MCANDYEIERLTRTFFVEIMFMKEWPTKKFAEGDHYN